MLRILMQRMMSLYDLYKVNRSIGSFDNELSLACLSLKSVLAKKLILNIVYMLMFKSGDEPDDKLG